MLFVLSASLLQFRKFKMQQRNRINAIPRGLSIALLVIPIGIIAPEFVSPKFVSPGFVAPAFGQSAPPAQHTERPAPPTRDPNSPGYVTAKELPDGSVPSATADGNFIIGPTHTVTPETTAANGLPKGAVIEFPMNSSDTKIFPGIAREAHTFGAADPADPAKLVVTTS